MTNDPDLVLKSHESVARDPTSWLRVGLGCREGRRTLLELGGPNVAYRHTSAHSLRATNTGPHQQAPTKILFPATSA